MASIPGVYKVISTITHLLLMPREYYTTFVVKLRYCFALTN